MSDFLGLNLDHEEFNELTKLVSSDEYLVLRNIFLKKIFKINNLQNINGEAFNDGRQVGKHEGWTQAMNFMLDIRKEIVKK